MTKLRSEDGAALIWALVLLMILSIFAMSVIFMSRQNTFEISREYNFLRSGYIAEAGIELAYHTLMAETGSGDERYIDTLTSSQFPLQHSEVIRRDGREIGRFDAQISRQEIDEQEWVVITSTAQLTHGNFETVRTMRINRDNIREVIREETYH